MAFFKSRQEKEIEEQMRRDEQLELFNEQINIMKSKREEYALIAAEAEVNGDKGTYDSACNNIIELTNVLSSLLQTKANFDLINVSNSIATSMATAMNALDQMAGKAKLPNIKKMQKANAKVVKYMREVKIANKAMSSSMKMSNPANHSRTPQEIEAIRPMIDAARAKLAPKVSTGAQSISTSSSFDLSKEIEAEKNKLI